MHSYIHRQYSPAAKLGAHRRTLRQWPWWSSGVSCQQGFPAITVPAGFTTEVYDRVRDACRRSRRPQPTAGEGGGAGTPREGTTAGWTHRRKAAVAWTWSTAVRPNPSALRIASAFESRDQASHASTGCLAHWSDEP